VELYASVSLCETFDTCATNVTRYVWGQDISGTLQGAGGVGGLLTVIRDDGVFAPCYDANGNVTEYVVLETGNPQLATGSIAAHYEYDAFGNLIPNSSFLIPNCPDFRFRFSTKYLDSETGNYSYIFRPYSPHFGRFLSQDPIEERGGLNLYGFCANDPINKWDYLGLLLFVKSNGLYSKELNKNKTLPDGTLTLHKVFIDASLDASFDLADLDGKTAISEIEEKIPTKVPIIHKIQASSANYLGSGFTVSFKPNKTSCCKNIIWKQLIKQGWMFSFWESDYQWSGSTAGDLPGKGFLGTISRKLEWKFKLELYCEKTDGEKMLLHTIPWSSSIEVKRGEEGRPSKARTTVILYIDFDGIGDL
jgi:RHS repeat-associated protein